MSDGPLVPSVSAPGGKVVVAESIGTIVISPSGREYRRVFVGVPAPGQPLVGREAALADVRRELLAGGLVARTGLPGVGKTALALAIVREDAILEHFEGGVLWAGLGPVANLASVLARWGTMLELDLSAELTVADRAQRLHDHLQTVASGKPLLFVLDDTWEWEDLAPFRVFAEPGNALLVTTRDQELARRFTRRRVAALEELDEAASVALLASICPEAMIDPRGLQELARAVGGLPLALVLIGGELASNAGLELWVRQTIEHLKTAQARLALVDFQDRPGMEGVSPTLQAVFEMSLSALGNEQAQTAFAELAAFAAKPADFTRDAAVHVWALEEPDVDRCLRLLAQRNLLEISSGGRFALHQLLAQLARLRLGGQGTQVCQRHFEYYVSLANRDRDDWRVIEAELPQIREAWAWASTSAGQDERVLELVSAVRRRLQLRGLGTTLLSWYERALTAARVLGRVEDESVLLNDMGEVHRRRGDLDLALDYYAQALAISIKVEDRVMEAATLNNAGAVHKSRGEMDQALDYFEQALLVHRAVGNQGAATLNNIGEVHRSRGEVDQALDYFEQALAISHEAGDRVVEATTLNNIGAAHEARGELGRALDYYNQALPIQRVVGDRAMEATTLNNIGAVHKGRGELDRALDYFDQALPIHRAIGNRAMEATTLNNIGLVHYSRGELDQALDYYNQALPIHRAVGNRAIEATTLNNIGLVHYSRAELDQALDYYNQALPISHEVGDRAVEATTLNNVGLVHHSRGELQQALDYYNQALPIHRAVGNRVLEAITLTNIGAAHRSRGELERALDYFDQALPIHQQMGDRYEEGFAFFHLGQLVARLGRRVEGARLVAVCYLIDQEVGHTDVEQDLRNLREITDQLGYSQEQLDQLVNEVSDAYRADRGDGLLRAALEGTSVADSASADQPK